MVVTGAGSQSTVIDCGWTIGAFASNNSLQLTGLTVLNGYLNNSSTGGAGVSMTFSQGSFSLALQDVWFFNHVCQFPGGQVDVGGAVSVVADSTVSVTITADACYFGNNTVQGASPEPFGMDK